MKMVKKTYTRPQLVEYGKLADVTRGFVGSRQDNGFFQNINAVPNSDDCTGGAFLCGAQSS